jgi:GntR family transcriptional repressor for pyruvate dehydrogenase complex
MSGKDPSITPLRPARGTDSALAAIGRIARSSVVEAVAERIRSEILAGRLEAGARLPAERELATTLGINRLTLRAALGRLEAMGLVATKHGAGTVVTSWRERAGLDALGSLAAALPPSDPGFHEMLAAFLEVRRILAAEGVALAAARHRPEDVERLRAIAEEQQQNVSDPLALARGDVAFQRAVIRASGNVALELVLNSFARLPDEQPELVTALYEKPEETLAAYPLVIELVRAGDAEKARKLVRAALEAADDALLARQAKRAGLARKTERAPARDEGAKARRKGGTR